MSDKSVGRVAAIGVALLAFAFIVMGAVIFVDGLLGMVHGEFVRLIEATLGFVFCGFGFLFTHVALVEWKDPM